LGVNQLEVSRLYALMRKRLVPSHRTEPFIEVGKGGGVDQTEFEETSPTKYTQVPWDLERRTLNPGDSPSETALPTE
jgi:hypothetical protein